MEKKQLPLCSSNNDGAEHEENMFLLKPDASTTILTVCSTLFVRLLAGEHTGAIFSI
jgi:hypothetical protein